MVKAEDSRSRGCGFESHRMLDEKLTQCHLKETGKNKGSQPQKNSCKYSIEQLLNQSCFYGNTYKNKKLKFEQC